MCPLRFILVFFSAALAGYLAWKTVTSADEPNITIITPDDSTLEKKEIEKPRFQFLKMMKNGFWVFIDMASGRYLWRNVKQLNSCSLQPAC
ncbi:Methyltransferase-related protein [Striga hermonthica]|uniref:Methyltransferase-related protein n=1 Tax=Striga hermonthica TaxID=68872 RepID=A0A9N7MT81_STRHE|nr:Methyltransferase-related protein [Striga hermonthica]